MIVAIEGQDGVGKTSAINRINQFMHMYQYGLKFPAYNYSNTTFLNDAEYVKTHAQMCIETFLTSNSFAERIDALKRFDYFHTVDKLLCAENIENMNKKEIYLFDRYCLSQAIYSKACAEILLEDYDDIYYNVPDKYSREIIKDLWYNVGVNDYMLPKIKLTIVFVADANNISDRLVVRGQKDMIDSAARLQQKVNQMYLDKIFTEQYSNSEYTVTINTSGMTVDDMAEKIKETITMYSHM